MRPVKQMGALLLAAAMAGTGAAAARQAADRRPELDFSGSVSTEGTGEDTAFARSVAARYAGVTSVADIMADVAKQGFRCVPEHASCTRTRTDDPCVQAWVVDFTPEGIVSGRHVRRCLGGELDE